MEFKQIKIVLPDGRAIVFDKQTSDAIGMYAQAKNLTIDQALDEILKGIIKKVVGDNG